MAILKTRKDWHVGQADDATSLSLWHQVRASDGQSYVVGDPECGRDAGPLKILQRPGEVPFSCVMLYQEDPLEMWRFLHERCLSDEHIQQSKCAHSVGSDEVDQPTEALLWRKRGVLLCADLVDGCTDVWRATSNDEFWVLLATIQSRDMELSGQHHSQMNILPDSSALCNSLRSTVLSLQRSPQKMPVRKERMLLFLWAIRTRRRKVFRWNRLLAVWH